MASSRFEGDPFGNLGTVYFPDGTSTDTTVEAFTQGRFTISGGQLVDTSNPFNRLTLGQQGNVVLWDAGAGRVNVQSETVLGAVNRMVSGDLLRTVEGTVNIVGANGEFYEFEVNNIPVTHAGHQVLAYTTTDGGFNMIHVPGTYANSAEVQVDWGMAYRLATPGEAIRGAIWKELLTTGRDELERFIEENGITGEETGNKYSDALRMIIAMGDLSGIRTFSQYLIGGPGD